MADRKLFEALYQSIARDLQKMKGELMKEISETSARVSALEEASKVTNPNDDVVRELRYTQKQLQSLYEGIEEVVTEKSEDVKAAVAGVSVDAIDYDRLADLVAEKLAAKEQTYEVVVDDAGIEAIAEKVSDKLGGVTEEETSYDLVLDEEGISAIAKGVADELRRDCVCAPAEPAPVEEEPVDTSLFTPIEETVAEEVAEEPAPVAEPVVEEVAEEPAPVAEPAPAVQEEIAATTDPVLLFDELDENNLVDAETGLVIRLKKSFTAKLKQSEENIKEYYSQIKNELTSYKKVNSNVSWHGDRFNFGRDTIAKMNICGKTLCVYLALDPNDPEFKSTVYHQKDVGNQKAYESTPFMVKVKSDAAAKKAVRLAAALADKLATEKEENFVAVDYVAENAYETTKKLYEDGFIKATKEKKVDLNF